MSIGPYGETVDMNLLDDDVDDDDNAWSRREAARMKQIQIGKARPEYQRYMREVTPSQRRPNQPSTPDPSARVSKRQFDRALADWRRLLHDYDIVPRCPPHSKNYQDDSEAPRGRHRQFRDSAGEGGFGDYDDSRSSPQAFSRAGRRFRGTVVHRGERSIGKFGPRKPANDTLEDELVTTQLASEVEEALGAPGAPPGGAVRISLADQLWEMPFPSTANSPVCAAWPWFDVDSNGNIWNNVDVETPEKMLAEMQQQYMLNMETPDKLIMPFHGMDAAHQACFGSFANADDNSATMAMDSHIVPHKMVFDVPPVPENPEECQVVETLSSQIDTQLSPRPALVFGESDAQLSPRPASNQQEMLSLKFQSPSVGCLASPTPRTPKRQHYVPDTPSPSRMHFSWMQPPSNMQSMQPPSTMQSLYPWHSNAAAFDSYQAMPPEFLQGHPELLQGQGKPYS